MAWIAGVDGCKGGWIAVYEETGSGELECRVEKTFSEVMKRRPPLDAVAVDMPIGLWAGGGRACDKAAREVLGKRQFGVSSPPPPPMYSTSSAKMTSESFRNMTLPDARERLAEPR